MAGKEISRRGFLRGRFRDQDPEDGSNGDGADGSITPDTPASRRPRAIPLLRPPGAIDEPLFMEKCTACDRCIDACPHDVLFRAGPRFRAAAGTPTFDPALAACVLCEDMPCVTACDTGALIPEIGFQMGTALIDTQQCLAHQGTFCSVCYERCPV
ncbi:MAG: 4Fe-4S dicluster domain-containing protein, partial [Gemmatimonadetes bacterium]|nr:4Fe-4S dicluster domain-containing protein [Gemmatimonadota bacterium]